VRVAAGDEQLEPGQPDRFVTLELRRFGREQLGITRASPALRELAETQVRRDFIVVEIEARLRRCDGAVADQERLRIRCHVTPHYVDRVEALAFENRCRLGKVRRGRVAARCWSRIRHEYGGACVRIGNAAEQRPHRIDDAFEGNGYDALRARRDERRCAPFGSSSHRNHQQCHRVILRERVEEHAGTHRKAISGGRRQNRGDKQQRGPRTRSGASSARADFGQHSFRAELQAVGSERPRRA
jgi:hypothetical protein